MAQPTPFARSNDYSEDSANSVGGRDTIDPTALDAEIDAIATTLSEILTNLALIQRDDGDIRDNEVKLHTLAPGVLALITAAGATFRGSWTTATAYAVADVVTESGATYLCGTAHTSGTFSTDLTAEKWVLIANAPDAFAADAISVTPAGGIAATDAQAALEELDSEKLAKASNLSDVASASTALSNLGALPLAGGTMTGLLVLSADPSAALGAATKQYADANVAGLSAGHCRLDYVSGTQIKLSRYNGNKLFINGAWETIPSAGVTLGVGGLSANTFYYIYAFMNGGTMTLEASATARAVDSTYGHQIKNGDSSRTLVGIAKTNGSTQYVDQADTRYVASWFNRRLRSCYNTFGADKTENDNTATEIATSIRANFIGFLDTDAVLLSFGCRATPRTGDAGMLAHGSIDGASYVGPAGSTQTSTTTNRSSSMNGSRLIDPGTFTEAASHYATILGDVTAGHTWDVYNSGSWVNAIVMG